MVQASTMSEYYDQSCHFYGGAPDYYEQCRFYRGPNHYPGYTYAAQYQDPRYHFGETSRDRQTNQSQEQRDHQAGHVDATVAKSKTTLGDGVLDISSAEESHSGCSEESGDSSLSQAESAHTSPQVIILVGLKAIIYYACIKLIRLGASPFIIMKGLAPRLCINSQLLRAKFTDTHGTHKDQTPCTYTLLHSMFTHGSTCTDHIRY